MLGFAEQARRSVHYSYEMVALSHATAREFGYETSRGGRQAVRRGVGPQGSWRQGRRSSRPADGESRVGGRAAQPRVRRQRMCAGPRKTSRPRPSATSWSSSRAEKSIAFDIDEALSFEGESGPYLQYATVRANNIFAKLKEREGLDADAILQEIRRLRHRRADRRIATTRTSCGVWCSRRPAWTKSSTRPSGRWSCRCWRSTRSTSASSSTASTTASRF